jgi:CheY-like chemotaxis protein
LLERSEQLRQLTGQLTVAEQRERQRLAQVLHDGLQQILVAAKYRLAFIERDSDLHSAKNEVSELIYDAIETSRSLTAELSPPVLLQGSLVPALEWLARWMRDKHGLDVSLTAHKKIKLLTNEAVLLLFQSVRELLFNVVKHSGVKKACVEVDRVDGGILIAVEDKGVGFDMNQLHTKGDLLSGTGLLSMQERISYMGGHMEIDSAPGQGSRHKLIAPISVFAQETEPAAREKSGRISVAISPELRSETSGTGKKIRIVLVDDHLVMRQGLAGLLRGEPDFEIAAEASDGESAIKLAREIRPDVTLMDISMPGMDGIQAATIIHKEFPEIRIIGLSMFQEDNHRAAMCKAGAVAYLTKTGPSEELIDTIRTCVR